MEELKGHKILSVEVSRGERYLRFTLESGQIVYKSEGDCYSKCWFADIIGIENLIGGTVIEVESVDLPGPGYNRTGQNHDEKYGYKTTTEKGISEIIYRNSSNGYYGGWLTLIDSHLDGVVWKKITV